MATINFLIQGNNNPSGIYIRLKDGKLVDVKAKTKYSIDPENWSKAKGQPKNLREANMKLLQQHLTGLRTELLNHYNNSVSNQTINTQWLKQFINPPAEKNSIPNRLLDYFDYYEMHKKTSLKKSTLTKLLVNKHLLERFQQWAKTDFQIRDVNADFKLRFEQFCEIENYAPNTIARALKFIKTICYHAASHGVDTHYQLKSIITKTVKVDKIYLTPDEIEKISQTVFEQDYLDNARDWLIISCETGQRVSDFMRFKSQMIRYEGMVPLVEFTQVKTGKIMAIPLSKRVRAILEKRGGEFPRRISDQRYNEYVKEVCKLSGLVQTIQGSKINPETLRKETGHFPKYELVTSHIGRRSFATNNYGYIPTSLLINVTGHATESLFLEYIGKTVTEKAIQLAEYF